MMKKERALSKILYVFVVLSLIYTCYMIFKTYDAYSEYVVQGTISNVEVIELVISSMFMPLVMTVILYALASMNDMFIRQFEKSSTNEVTEIEVVDEAIESEEIIDKTEKA